MLSINQSGVPPIDSTGSSRRANRIPFAICTSIALVILPLSAGCSPGVLVTTLLVVPVAYAHLCPDSPLIRHRPEQRSMNPSRIHTISERPSSVPAAHDTPRPQAPALPAPREIPSARQSAPSRQFCSPATTRGTGQIPMTGTLPTPKTSPPPAKQAMPSPILEGATAYREMRWEDAVMILNRAISSGTCTGSQRSKAHILLGAMEYQQGNLQAARMHFATAHRLDAQTEPSPQLFPPQLIRFYRTVNGIKGP